ncbi:MAG: hypothetical protein L0H55_15550, partial [Candidatus Nitrosocosmicus sp.]|nr:hypothetical protein [Candidatus Nitrosocosmicus sp.]
TNNNIGITFEYPSEWDLDERTNRFANEPDVEVSDGLNSFKFIDSDPAFEETLESFDLEFIAELGKNTFTKGPDERLIEDVDMNSYSIDGKDTATFLYTAIEDFEFVELEYATQVFFIDNEGKIYSAIYRDTVSNFDDPQSQAIMNHILESFKFINSEDDNVSNNDDGNEDDGENN